MGELLLYGWASGVLSAWDSRNFLMLAVLIGGPLAFFAMASRKTSFRSFSLMLWLNYIL